MIAKRKPGRPTKGPQPDPVDPTPTTLAPAVMGAEGLANLKQAAAFLGGVHVDTVRNLIHRGELPVRRVGYRVMVPWAALKAYVAG